MEGGEALQGAHVALGTRELLPGVLPIAKYAPAWEPQKEPSTFENSEKSKAIRTAVYSVEEIKTKHDLNFLRVCVGVEV